MSSRAPWPVEVKELEVKNFREVMSKSKAKDESQMNHNIN